MFLCKFLLISIFQPVGSLLWDISQNVAKIKRILLLTVSHTVSYEEFLCTGLQR